MPSSPSNVLPQACRSVRKVCRVATVASVVALALFLSVSRPHIGFGPPLTFTSIQAPADADLIEAREWLEQVADVLVDDGYHHSVLQVFSPGQVFGLVKPLDDMWEYHVRGFTDGSLQSEIELSRDYIQHLSNDYRADAAACLVALLDDAGIDWTAAEPVAATILPVLPAQPVSWKNLALLSPVFTALVALDDAVHGA